MRNKILLLNTGGTIAMRSDVAQGSLPYGLDEVSKKILKDTNKKRNIVSLEVYNLFNLPSPHINFEHLFQISLHIINFLSRADSKAVIVTQGTDTLEESSYFLSLVLNDFLSKNPNKCVAITGSMKDQSHKKYDGITNISNATTVCLLPKSSGVFVVFHKYIFNPSFIYKSHATKLNAFKGGKIGSIKNMSKIKWKENCIKIYDDKAPVFSKKDIKTLSSKKEIPEVVIISSYLGTKSININKKINALILEGTGCGNTSIEIAKELKKLQRQGVPVYLTSRILHTMPKATYGYAGGGGDLEQSGIILESNAIKLRIFLIAKFLKDSIC